MTDETERWLSPMVVALLVSNDGGTAFARIVESVMMGAVVEAMFDDLPVGAKGLDWIRLGQLIRVELGWAHYPLSPTRCSAPREIESVRTLLNR